MNHCDETNHCASQSAKPLHSALLLIEFALRHRYCITIDVHMLPGVSIPRCGPSSENRICVKFHSKLQLHSLHFPLKLVCETRN